MPDFDWFDKKREPPEGELPTLAVPQVAAEPAPAPVAAETAQAPRRRRRSSSQSVRSEAQTSQGDGTVGVVQETLRDVVGSKLRESGDEPDEMWRLMAEMGFQDDADNRAALTAAEGDVEVTPMPQERP